MGTTIPYHNLNYDRYLNGHLSDFSDAPPVLEVEEEDEQVVNLPSERRLEIHEILRFTREQLLHLKEVDKAEELDGGGGNKTVVWLEDVGALMVTGLRRRRKKTIMTYRLS
ncbi:hypothetical protein Bca52824_002580 [Brassica carinata]|uniref:Uncharacterized protein n=1 Tax=Brassica carinata TaxID=52824 RepID=A0A8X7WLF6_BRACI|nr:hypothetical protein Bca52824_002580 [Brassica carinata]